MRFDLINENVYLYASAYVEYEAMNNNAKYIRIDFRNNVIYDWGFKAGYDNFTNEFVELNYVGNYLIAGPSTTALDAAFESSGFNTRIFQAGNYFDVNRNGAADGKDIGWAIFKRDLVKAELHR